MPEPTLRRSLTLPLLTLYGLGNILGAGIYVLVGKVAGHSGPNTILAFLIAMVIAALTAMSYMELSSRYPKSASASIYLYEAFKNRALSVAVGIALVLGGITSAAALSKGFAGYLDSVFSVNQTLAAVALIILLGLVAAKGIGESAKLAALFTVIEVVGLLIIILAGHSHLSAHDFTASFHIDQNIGLGGVLFGAFLAFYAFIGFEDMVNVSEEVRKPRINMPLSILLSLVFASILYILVVMVSLSAVGAGDLARSNAPLNLVFDRVSHIDPVYISLIGLAATVNGALVQIIMGSRILYGLSAQGWLNKKFSKIHKVYRTPLFSTAVITLAMVLFILFFSLVSLAELTSLLILSAFTLVNASLVVLKHRDESEGVIFKVPAAVPVLGCVSCMLLIGFQLLGN